MPFSIRNDHARTLRAFAVVVLVGAVWGAAWTGSAFAGSHTTTTSTTSGDGYAYGRMSEQGRTTFEWAIIENDHNTSCSISDEDHWGVIKKLQKEVDTTDRPIFWFERDDQGYVIRDQDLVDKALEIVKPMGMIGGEQGKLGAIQGELGRQQGMLGALQGQAGAIQGRLAALSINADDKGRAEIEALSRELEALQTQLRDIGRKQAMLGERQRELGARQEELGHKQAEASKRAQNELVELATQALKSGKAEKFDR
jgi:hypothetical protein